MPPLTLGRKQRLVHRSDFERLAKTAPSASDARLVVYVSGNEVGTRRLGVSVGKRVGGAVQRNRVKRLLREAFRLRQHDLPADIDVLMVAKPAADPSLPGYQHSLSTLVTQAFRRIGRSGG